MISRSLRRYLLDPFTPEAGRQKRDHIVELDSFRGLAALFVVFHHFVEGWEDASPPHLLHYLHYVPFLINGSARVMLFYVLSGFVLTLPLLSARKQDYPNYVLRRIARIYLPYVAALVLAVLGCAAFYGREMYGPVFHTVWRSPPSVSLVAQHLALLGRYDVDAYNPPTWSLVHEMRISLIFPLLCLVTLRLRAWAALLVALSFPVVARMQELFGTIYYGDGPGASSISWTVTVGFCGLFLIGSLAARYRRPLVRSLIAAPAALRWTLFLLAVVLYQYNDLLHVPRSLRNFTVGLAAAYLITQSQVPDGWLSRLLCLAPLRFLGRISYSLYLIHVPILMVLAIETYGKFTYGYLFVPFLTASILAAIVFHQAVEVPAIALGKAIGRKRRVQRPAERENSIAMTEPLV